MQGFGPTAVTNHEERNLMDQNEINDRVARGAALLDAEVPGWHDRIDLDVFDLGDEQQCILGQLYDDGRDGYSVGAERLRLSLCPCCSVPDGRGDTASYGFEDGDDEGMENAWRVRIDALRNEQVQVLLECGWLLSRDSLAVISPATGQEVSLGGLREQYEALLARAS